ncbi:lipopolysaccharide assembly protein LapA domain-containing protein [Candidatus Bipolaricaulota bacterium]
MRAQRIRWRLIGVLTLVLLFAIIILQNTQVVDIRVLFWQLSMSRIILLLFSLVVGFVVGYYIKSRRRGTQAEHAIVRPKERQ